MEYRSVNEMVLERVRQRGDRVVLRYKRQGAWHEVTWREFNGRIRNLALFFVERGLTKGDRVCVIGDTRLEWDIADRAILMFGGVTVGVYQTLPPEQVQYIISHCEAKTIVIENKEQFDKIVKIQTQCPELKHWIVMDPNGCEGREFQALDDVTGNSGNREDRFGEELDRLCTSIAPGDIATLIYTSGTTGPPKGAMITHGNLLAQAHVIATETEIDPDTDSAMLWLPLSHIMQRANTLAGVWVGGEGYYVESIDKLPENLLECRPTIFYSVPRVLEKVYAKILDGAEKAGFPKKQIFTWSMKVGRRVSQHRQEGKPLPPWLRLQQALADRLVFARIRDALGGRIRLIASSAAPIAREILEFFHAAGLHVCEAYGATELTGAVTINTPTSYRFGTVGYVVPGMQVRIAEDGEIMAKGDMVFAGYYKDEDLTKEVLGPDGWYATGDIGEFDEAGFLKITDRKKNIIVTSGGKNVAPQNIENMFKRSVYVSQAMVHGDKRKYLTALITLEPETLRSWATEQGLPSENWEELCRDEKVMDLIQKGVDELNGHLAKFETIKKFRIVPEEFSIENGLLTPTLKLKRKVVTERYMDLLDSMYET